MNLNLTKYQRSEFYQQALLQFSTHPTGPYVCNVLKWICSDAGLLVRNIPNEFCRINFPEFHQQLNGVYCWADTEYGNKRRIVALRNAIEMCNK